MKADTSATAHEDQQIIRFDSQNDAIQPRGGAVPSSGVFGVLGPAIPGSVTKKTGHMRAKEESARSKRRIPGMHRATDSTGEWQHRAGGVRQH